MRLSLNPFSIGPGLNLKISGARCARSQETETGGLTDTVARRDRSDRAEWRDQPGAPRKRSGDKRVVAQRDGPHTRRAWVGLGVLGVAVAVAALTLLGQGSGSKQLVGSSSGAAASAQSEALTALGSIQRVSAAPLVSGGKPVVFFMGAQYCPFCAADRWAFVKATSRFGTWSGLKALASRGGVDGFASVPTYDLVGATYHSSLISLSQREVADLAGNTLEQLNASQSELVNHYDSGGGIPFTAAGGASGQYTIGLAYSPALLVGQSFEQIRQRVSSNANTPTVRAINAQTDAITALICKLTDGAPAGACSSPTIAPLERHLS